MRIALDARDALRRESGITVFTASIIAALDDIRSGDDFLFYVDEYGGPGPTVDVLGSGRPTAPVVLPGSDVIWKQWRLPRALRRDRADIFHSMTSTLPFRVPCPTVLTVCDLFHEVYPEHLPQAIQRRMHVLYSYAARRADRIIAISASTKRDLMRYYGIDDAKIDVIYPGVDDFYRMPVDAPSTDMWLEKQLIGRPYILHVGALSATRNVAALIEAFAAARESESDLNLVLIGQPYWGFDIDTLIDRWQVRDAITIIDHLHQRDLRFVYCGAAALVMPSLFEGFGLPVGEAMACGTPVIASSTTALPEAVAGAGILVDPVDIPALTAAIIDVVTDNDIAAELRAKGRQRVEKLSWRLAAQQTVAVYHSLA